jgi:DNA polymerase III epsilon subunit-like protein
MTHRIMLDIETLGLEPGAAIVSIGACRFDHDGPTGEGFYVEIDPDNCCEHGLEINGETLEWWREQDADLAPLGGDVTLPDALARFNRWADPLDEVWANSPSFDCEMLETAYDAVDMTEPWEYYHERDVRTLRSLPGAVELEMDGREHHALDDARHQAREVAATLQSIALGGGA